MKIKILQLLQSKENRKLQDLNSQLSKLQEIIEKEQKDIFQIKKYSNEYRVTLNTKLQEGLSKEFLEYYYKFIRYLDKVIKDQEHVLQRLLAQKKFLISMWQKQFLKNKTLEQMLLVKGQEKMKILDKKIEKAQDELVASRINDFIKD